jgi:epoxyqueuosine reductase
VGDRLYGCDECQEVCPPNRRPDQSSEASRTAGAAEEGGQAWVDLVALLESDDDTLLARFGRWYIPERDPRYLRRTALVVLGNVGDPDDPAVTRVVGEYCAGHDELLREHADWAAARLHERAEGPGAQPREP